MILGIDPGSAVTGYGLVEKVGRNLVYRASGIISTSTGKNFPERLLIIHLALKEIIRLHRPEAIALEDIFYARNVQSALKLGHVRGVIILTAMQEGLKVFEYAPASIKQALTGYGRAEKIQIQRMVMTLLKIEAPVALDASDALATAICHHFTRKVA